MADVVRRTVGSAGSGAFRPAEPPVLGERFELYETLGSGGMAVVYRAWDRTAGRACAVKVLGDLLSRDEEFRRRFRGEARAVTSLTHPRIVAVYDWGEIPPHHYIAMEDVPGGTLADLMRRQGPLDEARALGIAVEVADALAYAHGRDVVHRDIKPHNILLTGDGHVKVADFGIARTLDATQLTRSGIVMGSAHYLSPEQARGDPAGPASDQYALGVVLYEMLAGGVPFRGEAPVAIALKHLREAPPNLRTVRPDLAAATVALVDRLLAKEPTRRYPSAAALAADLRRLFSEMPQDRLGHTGCPGSTEGALDETAALPSVDIPQSAVTAHLPAPAPSARTSHLPAAAGPGRTTTALSAPPIAHDTARMPAVEVPPRAAPSPAAGSAAARSTPGRRESWTRVGLSAGVAVCLLVLATAAYRAAWLATHVAVPSLIGRTVADAGKVVLPYRLGILVTGHRQDSRAAVGVILSQDPPPGAQVQKGSDIHLTVSQGSGLVPSLEGLPVDQAARALEAAGLRLGRTDNTPDDRAPAGTVIHQFQAPGTQLAPNQPVDVLISQGPPKFEFPFGPLFAPRHGGGEPGDHQ